MFIILKFSRETVPARSIHVPAEMDGLYSSLDCDQIKVLPHPNIVEMVTVFADQIPALPGDVQLYGDALPARLNPKVRLGNILGIINNSTTYRVMAGTCHCSL